MNSRELAKELGYDDSYIQRLTKKAVEKGEKCINIGGKSVSFRVVAGRGGRSGKSYRYTVLDEAKRVRKRRTTTFKVDLSELVRIDFTKAKIGVDEKLALVKFIRKSGVSVRAVAKVYSLESGVSEGSIYKRVYRWLEAYEKRGKAGLVDKRKGNRESKIRDDLFIASISKKANLQTYYMRYAYLDCKARGVAFDTLNPEKSCSVSYSGYIKYYQKRKSSPEIKAILAGVDNINLLEPKFKIKANYPNEMWEIDATSLDIFVKVPLINGEVNYFRRVESSEYVLKRYSLVGVVDRFSKARVYSLFRSDTSYSDVRLLKKAIARLGKPEIIRGDNGKNYVSRHFQDVLEDLGIVYLATNPYAGYEKPFVERGFRALQHNRLFESLPGFIGHNTEDRKKIENQASGKSLKGKSGVGTQTHIKEEFMWWWEAERVLDGLIEHLFNDALDMHKSAIREFKSVDNLHILLGKKHKRKLGFEGVYFNRQYYLAKELWSEFNIGDEITIYEEIDDVNRVWVKSKSGFVECFSASEFELSVEEAKEIKRAYKAKSGKVIKEALKVGKDANREIGELVVKRLSDLSTLSQERVEKVIKTKEKSSDSTILEIAKAAGYFD